MTATDRLRALLDERGVEWDNTLSDGAKSAYFTEWMFNSDEETAVAREWSEGELDVTVCLYNLTPEEAVDVTLGRGECHNHSPNSPGKMPRLRCSECGCITTLDVPNGGAGYVGETVMAWPMFCSNCGRKVLA